MSDLAIEVDNLSVSYKMSFPKPPKEVLKGISFQVKKGCIFGFLGPNGAGKTTAIKTMLGLNPNFSGNIKIFDSNISDLSLHDVIGYSPENAYFSSYLTPYEVLYSMGKLSNMKANDIETAISFWLDHLNLSHVKNHKISTFSKGMKQRLNLIQSLLHNPDLYFLDEPASGLDPLGKKEIKLLMQKLKSENKTVFVSSHHLLDAQEYCDEICILNHGNFITQGALKDLLPQSQNLEGFFIEKVQATQESK
ncbi:MAG: ABC transporter ATP-binding protein [Candidatus Cloacimonetes bacterium]|nr:ABC transporter ATP-binding protein [Candidatus Cloacimonadota bacterium]